VRCLLSFLSGYTANVVRADLVYTLFFSFNHTRFCEFRVFSDSLIKNTFDLSIPVTHFPYLLSMLCVFLSSAGLKG